MSGFFLARNPQTSKPYTFVVGNALSGDTVNTCDYLDPGNGTGLAAAFAAANALGYGVDIMVKAGTITLNPALVTLPLVLPQKCSLIGAGKKATKIILGSGVGGTSVETFHFLNDSTVNNIGFEAPALAADAPLAYNFFGLGTFVTIKDVYVFINQNTVATSIYSIFNSYFGVNTEGVLFDNVTIEAPNLGTGYSGYLGAFYLEGTGSSTGPYVPAKVPAKIINCNVIAPGQSMQGLYSNFIEYEINGLYVSGIYGVYSSVSGYNTISSSIVGPQINNVTVDSRGFSAPLAAGFAGSVYISILNAQTGSANIIGTKVNNIYFLGDTNTVAPDAVVVTSRNTISHGSIETVIAYAGDTVVPRLGIFTDNGAVMTDFAIHNCEVHNGLILSSASASTVVDTRIIGCRAATVTITSGNDKAIVSGNRITTALNNSGTNTLSASLNIVG